MVEPFSQIQVDAARRQIQEWGHDLDAEPEKLARDLEHTVMNEFSGRRYGSISSVEKDSCVFLMDEYNHKKDFLNCGLTGYNIFLLYYALGFSDQLRLLYTDNSSGTTHASLLRYDNGLDEDPLIIDPLFKLHGRVRFVNDRIIYTPEPLLEDKENDEDAKQSKRVLGSKVEDIIDAEQVGEEIKKFQSKNGMIDYFADGQRLISATGESSEARRPYYEMEMFAQTIDDKLAINVTFHTNSPVFFTNQVIYSLNIGEKIMQIEGRKFLHLDNTWGVSRAVFDTDVGYCPEALEEDIQSAAFVFMIRSMHRGTADIKTQYEWLKSHKEMRKDLGIYVRNANISVDGNLRRSILSSEISSEEKNELSRLEIDVRLGKISSRMLEDLTAEEKEKFLLTIMASEVFRTRTVKLDRPYFKLTKEEIPTLEAYMGLMKKILYPDALRHHQSPISRITRLRWGQAQHLRNVAFS